MMTEKHELVLYSVLFAWLMFFGIFLLTVSLISGCFFVITQLILRGKPTGRRMNVTDESVSPTKRERSRIRHDMNRPDSEKKARGKLILSPFTYMESAAHRENNTNTVDS